MLNATSIEQVFCEVDSIRVNRLFLPKNYLPRMREAASAKLQASCRRRLMAALLFSNLVLKHAELVMGPLPALRLLGDFVAEPVKRYEH